MSPSVITPVPHRGLSVPPHLVSSPFRPLSSLHYITISPVFLAKLFPHFTPAVYSLFPTPNPRPGFLKEGLSIFSIASPQPQSSSLGCFSPPVYATFRNKGQDPSSSSQFGGQVVNDAEHKSPWLCQKAPRRALPWTSFSVPAATDKSTVSTNRNIKQPSTRCAQTVISQELLTWLNLGIFHRRHAWTYIFFITLSLPNYGFLFQSVLHLPWEAVLEKKKFLERADESKMSLQNQTEVVT